MSASLKDDNVSEGKRVSTFGLLSGVVSAVTVCGTLAARFLPTACICQVAAVLAVLAAVYLKIFLKETSRVQIDSALEEPILKSIDQSSEAKESLLKNALKKIPLPKDIMRLLKTSNTVSLTSFVAFFNSVSEAGI